MNKWLGCLVTACIVVITVGCGTSSIPTTPSASALPAGEGLSGGRSTTRQAGIQCSDAPVRWVTTNYSPVGRTMSVRWVPVPSVETYQVEVRHNRNGETPAFVYSFYTNRTEASIDDREDGGRYYVRVRVKNPCDVYGAWSETLIIYVDGRTDSGSSPYVPPANDGGDNDQDEDDCEADDNNGHGNDCDHNDDDNPGNS